tara:strand:+ start:67 stop:420 length:354 start_codon:yes stop_codon:yes gene_type:complete
MAIPSGSGTEVLKRVSLNDNSNAWTPIITGVANHIYTILSVTFCETANNASTTVAIKIDVNAAGSNEVSLLDHHTAVPAYGSFVWNDKFVMTGTDKLIVYSSANMDIYVSYIDQDWT